MIDSATILAILALVAANAARGLRSAISMRCRHVATLNGGGKPMFDGSLVFALFNTAEDATRISINFDALGIEDKWLVRDLWRQKDEGIYGIRYSAEVPGHATHLVRLFPKDDARLASGVADIRMNAVYRQFEAARHIDKPGYKAPKTYPCERCGDK